MPFSFCMNTWESFVNLKQSQIIEWVILMSENDIGVRLRRIEDSVEYIETLDEYKARFLICAAVKDTMHGVSQEQMEAFRRLGMEKIPNGWNGYVFVMDHGDILLERVSGMHGFVHDCLDISGLELRMVGKSHQAGNRAGIVFEGYDYAVNWRGMNIVVMDVEKRKLVDSISFDFFPKNNYGCKHLQEIDAIPVPNKTGEIETENCVDINWKLDEIIQKYQLDEYYPRYGNLRKAEQAIRSMADSWAAEENILCIAIGRSKGKAWLDEKHFRKPLTDRQRDQVMVLSIILEDQVLSKSDETYEWQACDFAPLERVKYEEYSRVLIISNSGDNFVGFWLRKHKIQYIRLYDYLAACGIKDVGRDEYYDFIPDKRDSRFNFENHRQPCAAWAFYEEHQLYDMYEEQELRLIIARKLFFLALILRNFLLAEKYLKNLYDSGEQSARYKKAWQEILSLLDFARISMLQRKQRDIFAVWIDQVGYDEAVRDMPFVASLQNKSIWFKDMITVTSFTRETWRTLYTAKYLVDDDTNSINNINMNNSPLLRILEGNGYCAKVYGEYSQLIFPERYHAKDCFQHYVPLSVMLWDMFRCTIMEKRPTFGMLHCLDTHEPFLYCGEENDSNLTEYTERMILSRKEADGQIEFYTKLMGENTTTIIFSDHGRENFYPRQHVFLSVYGKKYRSRQVEGLCSNIDFHRMVRQLVETGEVHENELYRDVAYIQGMPILSKRVFKKIIDVFVVARPQMCLPFRGYKGVVSKEYVYMHFAGGWEWLSRRDKVQPSPAWYRRDDDICDASMLPQMRELAGIEYGKEPPEYGFRSEDYMFLQDLYRNNYYYNFRKITLIRRLMQNISGRTAIYSGNYISRELYLAMTLEQRKKIVCVIDGSKECDCAALGLQVSSLEEAASLGVTNILTASRIIDAQLQEYVKSISGNIHVFGLYGWFEAHGYHTKYNFSDFAIEAEDEPLPSPYAVPDFLHLASPEAGYEIVAVVLIHKENADGIGRIIHSLLGQVNLRIRICCLDLTGTAQETVKPYQQVDNGISVASVESGKLYEKLHDLVLSLQDKYVMFLSSEDMLHPAGLSYLHEVAELHKLDVVRSPFLKVGTPEGENALADWQKDDLKKQGRFVSSAEERYRDVQENHEDGLPYGALCRTESLRRGIHRLLPELEGAESIFSMAAYLLAAKYVKVEGPVYIRADLPK